MRVSRWTTFAHLLTLKSILELAINSFDLCCSFPCSTEPRSPSISWTGCVNNSVTTYFAKNLGRNGINPRLCSIAWSGTSLAVNSPALRVSHIKNIPSAIGNCNCNRTSKTLLLLVSPNPGYTVYPTIFGNCDIGFHTTVIAKLCKPGAFQWKRFALC